jgi:CRISPR/Cas system CSM-associated protein Csm2 small subunit
MPLNITKLREFLTQINNDKTKKENYSSKIFALVHLVFTNLGFKVARIAKLSTVAKAPTGLKNDIEIIFCVAPDKPRKDVYPILENRLKGTFASSIKITPNPEYVHVEFTAVKCVVDLILLNQKDFDAAGYTGLRDINQIDTTAQDAIKLMKYAADQNGILKNISSGAIEKAAYSQTAKDLVICLEKAVYQIQNEFQKAGRKSDDILKIFR